MFKNALSRVLAAPLAIALLILFFIAIGVLTIPGLKTDLFPTLNFPILNIITEVPSFSSLEMERQVTLPMESAAGGVLGVTNIRSTSATGISMVTVEFEWGVDIQKAKQLLLEAVSQARTQIPSAARPTIENLSTALAMIEGYSFQGSGDPVKLRDQAVYELKPRLQRIPGVYKVVVTGGKIAEFSIITNPFLLIKYDLTLDDLGTAISSNNILASPGVLNHFSQELVLHGNGQFANITEIQDLVIAVKNGIPVRIRDVAQVTPGYQYERGDTSERGAPAILINIYKQPNFDTGEVADKIAREMDSFQKTLKNQATIRNYYDQAQLVRDSIGSVKESVWIGAILVVIVLAFFLHNLKTTLIVTLSIPLSVLAALIAIKVSGIGLNIMSLGGLAIGTGIIVDDAIVVLENIFRWFKTPALRKDLETSEVILLATSEVVRPVVISTLTNIGIFLPMIFIAGFAGRLFQPVSLTVTFALVASLIVALTVIPLLSQYGLTRQTSEGDEQEEGYLHRFYRYPLGFALKHPTWILGLAVVPILAATLSLRHLSVEFLPALDEGAILLQSIMPPGTSLPEAKRVGLKFENWLKDIPGVLTVTRRTGHASGAEDTDSINHSDIMVKLVPKDKRPVSLEAFIDALKEKTSPLPNVQINYLMPLADKINDALGGVPADIGVDLFGMDLDILHRQSEQLLNKLKDIQGLTDLRPPSDIPLPSLEINIDKKAAGKLGISERIIFDTLQAYSFGLQVSSIREVQKEIGIVLHFTQADANLDREALESLPLKTTSGNTVPLEQVAHITYGNIPSEINHRNLSRKLTVTANIKGRNTNDIASEISNAMNELNLPAGYTWGFSGKYQAEQDAVGNIVTVLLLAISVVALILWVEFRSWIQVGLILLTIPLASIGGILSLWCTRESLNVSSMIGAVMLVGIVVRNGIMLLDSMNLSLTQGIPLQSAITQAAQKRVRPILMTATVTILGLLPIAIGWGTGSELLRPLAVTVIGGLLTSTLLTLVVLPAATMIVLRGKKA